MRCSRNGLFTKKKARSAAGVPTMDASQKSPRLDVLPCENVSVNTTASPQATAKPHPDVDQMAAGKPLARQIRLLLFVSLHSTPRSSSL